MNKDDLKTLRDAMLHHSVVDGKAMVEITARALGELLDLAGVALDTREDRFAEVRALIERAASSWENAPIVSGLTQVKVDALRWFAKVWL